MNIYQKNLNHHVEDEKNKQAELKKISDRITKLVGISSIQACNASFTFYTKSFMVEPWKKFPPQCGKGPIQYYWKVAAFDGNIGKAVTTATKSIAPSKTQTKPVPIDYKKFFTELAFELKKKPK